MFRSLHNYRSGVKRRQSRQVLVRGIERRGVFNRGGDWLMRLVGPEEECKPGNNRRPHYTPASHCVCVIRWNAGRSFAAVAESSSGITVASAMIGMKLVSPPQRGTTWRWMWSAMPAPATSP